MDLLAVLAGAFWLSCRISNDVNMYIGTQSLMKSNIIHRKASHLEQIRNGRSEGE
jgi:hypothetical protein